MTTTRLTSTKLVVDDLESTKRFYCEAYGFSERGRVQAEMLGEPIDEYLLGQEDHPGVPLILMRYLERGRPPLGEEVALVFMADDLDALFERVRECGGRVLVEPFQSEHAPMRAGFTTDPEGHVIENIESPQGSTESERDAGRNEP
jgi:predicted enzyme related to lactoylglutathione lyase